MGPEHYVLCDKTGREITKIVLNQNNANGTIPSDIARLTSLKSVDFWNNYIRGTFPAALFELAQLTNLALAQNSFTGTIPDSFNDISKLNYLSLDQNQFTGALPPTMSALVNLRYLTSYGNRLKGTVPALPFSNMSLECTLDCPDDGVEGQACKTRTNDFSCPLPAGADKCISYNTKVGVHCL